MNIEKIPANAAEEEIAIRISSTPSFTLLQRQASNIFAQI